jgi:hypothetical protein
METVALALSILSFLLCLFVAVAVVPGFRRLTRLEDASPAPVPLAYKEEECR